MKILLTGSSGFLGKHIFSYLNQEYDIYTLSRTHSSINCDLSVLQPILPIVDIVIHSAGMAHILPKNNFEENTFFKVNVNGTQNLLSALDIAVVKPRRFIFISSVAVYGLNSGENINEDYPLLANDSYGKSKIETESLVSEWCIKNEVICTILRLPLVVGSNPKGNLGTMIKAIKNSYYFNIAGGYSKKSMVLATDLSKFILKASEIGGIYNLTDGYNPSFYELSNFIAKQLGKNSIHNMPYTVAKCIAFIGDSLGKSFPINSTKMEKITSTLTFDDSKARLAFGWNPNPILKGFKIYE
jgi:nucleoside-diphosphate-sugar epimerase